MIYSKPPTTFPEQAQMLLDRGLEADKTVLEQHLQAVNYYRLSGYLHTFRDMDPAGHRLDTYRNGTSFAVVWSRYRFDRQLRLLLLDGIERVEVALKTQLTYVHSHRYGAFGYLNPTNLPRVSAETHLHFLGRVREETDRSKEDFVGHFFAKYGDQHQYLPLWMAVEIMSFGTALTLFHGMAETDLKTIAHGWGIPLPLLDSWITSLNAVRNMCAHHARVWNRELGHKPKIPYASDYPDWHHPVGTQPNRMFAILTVIQYLLGQVAPNSQWKARLKALLADYPEIPLQFMGFPKNWHNHGVWQ